jgi:mono/diheme cytochrome c family protein
MMMNILIIHGHPASRKAFAPKCRPMLTRMAPPWKDPIMLRTIGSRAAIFLLLCTAPALAQSEVGNVAEGRKVVGETCSTCHAVEGPIADSQKAPPLAAVAQMPSTTSLSLHAFLLTPHPTMPNYQLAPKEVDDVVAYILSLRRSR